MMTNLKERKTEFRVLTNRRIGKGMKEVFGRPTGAKFSRRRFTEDEAKEIVARLKKRGQKALAQRVAPRDYKVLVQRRNKKGMREVRARPDRRGSLRRRFTYEEARQIVYSLNRRGRLARTQKVVNPRQVEDDLIKKWLRGDLDFDRELMVRLAKTARDTKAVMHVNYGKRTYAEQAALYRKYGPGRAARPGTSRHETGLAADVVFHAARWRNIGASDSARAAMKRYGLCLPVAGEPWHVEKGNIFRA
jgi:hypothetical protein